MQIRKGTDPEPQSEPDQGARLPEEPRYAEDIVDEVIAESFPASDPPQWWAGRPD